MNSWLISIPQPTSAGLKDSLKLLVKQQKGQKSPIRRNEEFSTSSIQQFRHQGRLVHYCRHWSSLPAWHQCRAGSIKGSLRNNEELASAEKVLQPRLQNLTEKHSVLILVKHLQHTPYQNSYPHCLVRQCLVLCRCQLKIRGKLRFLMR